jgi:hypothetical protein
MTKRIRRFRTRQADLAGGTWVGLDFRSYIDTGESKYSLSDPIIASVCGDIIGRHKAR